MVASLDLRRNLDAVKRRIVEAAGRVGRDPGSIRLVVVTKGHPVSVIRQLHELGEREIGESYVEEGLAKRLELNSVPDLMWHMIGHVQSRKAEVAAQKFDMVHSVDSLKLARRLDRFAGAARRVLSILLECNVSGEESKFGWPAWEESKWGNLVSEVGELLQLPNVKVQGLMSIAPYSEDPETARPYFARTRKLSAYFAERFPRSDWSQLSMGMSGDFEAAIRESATILRIGTAILGPRTE